MVDNITKSSLYGRKTIAPTITSPLVSQSEQAEIQKIRQSRFQAEQERRSIRKSEPIKKQNVSNLKQEISRYNNKISDYSSTIQRYKEKARDSSLSRSQRDKYDKRVEEYEVRKEAKEKGLNELKSALTKYERLNFQGVLANEDYSKRIKNYADDVSDAYENRTMGKIRAREKQKELIEKTKKETLAEGGFVSGGIAYTKEGDVKAVLTKEGEKSLSQASEIQQQIIQRAKDRQYGEQRVAFKNIITGQMMSIKSDKVPEGYIAVAIDSTGKQLPLKQQLNFLSENPQYRQKMPKQGFLNKINNAKDPEDYIIRVLEGANEKLNELRYKLQMGITRAELADAKNVLKNLKDENKDFRLIEDLLNRNMKDSVKGQEEKIKELEGLVARGQPSGSSQLVGNAIEILVDILIPPIGYADLAITFGTPLLRTSKDIKDSWWETIGKKATTGEYNLTKKDLLDIADSNKYTAGTIKITDDVIKSFKNKGFFDGLKDISGQAWDNTIEFYTKANYINEQKKGLEEIDKNLAEVKKNKDLYTRESYNEYLMEVENSKAQIKQNIEDAKRASFVIKGSTLMILLTATAEGFYLSRRKRIQDIELKNYNSAMKDYKKLNNLVKKDPSVKISGGRQVIDTYKTDFSKLNKLNFIDVSDLKNIKRVDVIKDSQAFVDRVPILQKFEVPQSFKKYSKANAYYYSYIPERLTPNQLMRMSPTKVSAMPGYKVYYKNVITLNIVKKNGKQVAFSFLSRSDKPIFNFKSLNNVVKYGSGKKFVLSSKLSDDIIQSHVARIRGDRLYSEGSFLTRQTDSFAGNRLFETRIASRTKKRSFLSADDYWLGSAKKGKTRVKDIFSSDISSGSPFVKGAKRTRSKTFSITDPLTIDLGWLYVGLRRRADILRRIKTKTVKQKKFLEIFSDAKSAVKKGKNVLEISPSKLKLLDIEDVNLLRSGAISATSQVGVSAPRIVTKIPAPIISQSKDVLRQGVIIQNSINAMANNIKKTIDKVETGRFVGTLTKNKLDKYSEDLKNIKSKLSKVEKNVKNNLSKSKQIVEKVRVNKYDALQVNDVVSKQQSLQSNLLMQKQLLKLRLEQINLQLTTMSQLTQTIRPSSRASIRPMPKRVVIPSFGFPSDVKRGKKLTEDEEWAYIAEVREKGKWRPISRPVSKSKALKRGVRHTSQTLSQSFRKRKTDIKIPKEEDEFVSLGNYYKKKEKGFNVWIEKPKAKINTKAEKDALKRARRKAKSADEYWLGTKSKGRKK